MSNRPARALARPLRTSDGQGLVEFALVIPVFLLMLFGLVDIGRYAYLNSTLSQAAREAARTAAVEAGWVGSLDPACNTAGGPVCPTDAAMLRNHALAAANRMMTPFSPVTLGDFYSSCDPAAPAGAGFSTKTCTNGSTRSIVSIRVEEAFQPLTPVIAQLVGPIPASGAATMVIN